MQRRMRIIRILAKEAVAHVVEEEDGRVCSGENGGEN